MQGDLPRNAPLVPAPAIRADLAPIVDDRTPQVVHLSLIIGRDLERKRLFVLEHRVVVQAKAGHARYPELDREHIALLAGWIVVRSGGRPPIRPQLVCGDAGLAAIIVLPFMTCS